MYCHLPQHMSLSVLNSISSLNKAIPVDIKNGFPNPRNFSNQKVYQSVILKMMHPL